MIVENQVDNMELCRILASKYNIPVNKVVEAVKHQYKVAEEHIAFNDQLSVRLPRIGTFRKMKKFIQ
jgi:hypothetical protein